MSTTEKNCIACGMPMRKPGDFPGGDMTKDYCCHCQREDGSMQSFEEKLQSMTDFIMRAQGFDKAAADELALESLLKLPAWKK